MPLVEAVEALEEEKKPLDQDSSEKYAA